MIKYNGAPKEISKVSDMPVMGLLTRHLFEFEGTPRRVLRVTVPHTEDDAAFRVDLVEFLPEPNPDLDKKITDLGVVHSYRDVFNLLKREESKRVS